MLGRREGYRGFAERRVMADAARFMTNVTVHIKSGDQCDLISWPGEIFDIGGNFCNVMKSAGRAVQLSSG